MAFDAFLKVESVDGECQVSGYEGWIEVLSYDWQVDQPVSTSASSAGNLASGKADFSLFKITKLLDKTSPKLALGAAGGEHYPSAILHLCRAGTERQLYMEYKLTDVMVSSFHPGGNKASGETTPIEEVAFNYGKIEWTYTQTKVAGGQGSGNVAAGWDLKTSKKV